MPSSPTEQLKAAGFSDQEIGDWAANQRETLTKAGFNDDEVNGYFGVAPDPKGVPNAFINRLQTGAQVKGAVDAVGGNSELLDALGDTKYHKDAGIMTNVFNYIKHVGKDIFESSIKPYGEAFERGKAGQPLVASEDLIPAGMNAAMMFGLKMGRGQGAPAGEPVGRVGVTVRLPQDLVGDAPIVKMTKDATGNVTTQEVGRLPTGEDFTTAGKILSGGERNIAAELKMQRLYEEHGITPMEAVSDAQHDATVRQSLVSSGTDLPERYTAATKAVEDRVAADNAPETPSSKPELQQTEIPVSPEQINPNIKINPGILFRGVEGGTGPIEALRPFRGGDIGDGVYLTPLKDLAGSYGGGPQASLRAGTRVVHQYELSSPLYPEDIAYVFGGTKVGESASIVSGNGIELWNGEWSSKAMEEALKQHEGIKMVIGTKDSIGRNQIAVRDRSILRPKVEEMVPPAAGAPPSEPPPPIMEPPPLAEAPRPPPSNIGEARSRILNKISIGEKEPKKGMSFDQLYTTAIDDLNPFSVALKKATGGEPVPISEDFYKLARLTRGTFGKADHFIRHGTFDFNTLKTNGPSLESIIEPVKKDLDDFRAYWVSRRVEELEAQGRPSGFDLDAARMVTEADKGRFEKVAQGLTDYSNKVLKYYKDAGMLRDEAYQAMLELNKKHVPFYRVFDEKKTGPSTGKSFGPGQTVKKYEGSARDIVDPLESVIKNTYALMNIAERNTVGRALIDKLGKLDEKIIEKVGDEKVEGIGEDGLPNELHSAAEAFRPEKEGTTLSAYKDGVKETYKSNDPELIKAFQQLDRKSANLLLKIVSAPARLLRAGATLTPDFMARNLIRDFQTMFINTANGIATPLRTAKGLVSVIKKDADFQDWLKSGGANSALVSLDRRYLQGNIEKLNRETGLMNATWNVVRHPIETLRVISELSENATRVGEFKAALKGKERTKEAIQEAGYQSREVTLDFSRIGSQMRAYNMITAFANANIQGIDRFVRAARERPVRTALAIAGANVIPSMLLWNANHDDPRYQELPQWQKDLFWIIMTKDHIYRVPKDFGVGVFFGSGTERVLEATIGKNPDAFKNFSDSVAQAFLPSVVPTVALPLVEQFANRSTFTNRTLVPDQMEKWLPDYQATPYTTQLAQSVGKLVGALPFINEEKLEKGMGGAVSRAITSPILMENYLRAWTGNLGQYALQATDAALRKAGVLPDPPQPASTLADIPFVKAFMVRFPTASAQSIQDFYDSYEKKKSYYDTWKAKAEEGDLIAVERLQAAGGPGMFVQLDQIKEALSTQSQMIRNIYKNPDPAFTPDERRQIIDSLYLSMIETGRAGKQMMRQVDEMVDASKTHAEAR